MPSRKRNKGKERKARKRRRNKGKERKARKKEAVANQTHSWRRWARGPDGSGEGVARCNHGCVIPPPDHAVSKFMNKLFDGALLSDSGEDLFVGIWCGLAESFEEHPDVWKDVENRQVAVGGLISIVTNMILERGTLEIWSC